MLLSLIVLTVCVPLLSISMSMTIMSMMVDKAKGKGWNKGLDLLCLIIIFTVRDIKSTDYDKKPTDYDMYIYNSIHVWYCDYTNMHIY